MEHLCRVLRWILGLISPRFEPRVDLLLSFDYVIGDDESGKTLEFNSVSDMLTFLDVVGP
ncbi:hypothetical protein TBK1r_64710 [Stieleria magnilauensis]|uniref:Uncharacterized protein n=1 Tax=Stieleria magnilauensis TaxID=2527963 RepID=A0ABX5Y1N2_9BACT|nr:hypothetical protein TBK1r_64710 [Planctomycetes bacterium TBK1r]